MSDYEMVEGDGASKIVVPCLDNVTKAAIDLTGKAIQLRYRIDGGAVVQRVMAIQGAPTLGRAEYTPLLNEITRGRLECEARIQPGLSDQLTSVHTAFIQVRAPLE